MNIDWNCCYMQLQNFNVRTTTFMQKKNIYYLNFSCVNFDDLTTNRMELQICNMFNCGAFRHRIVLQILLNQNAFGPYNNRFQSMALINHGSCQIFSIWICGKLPVIATHSQMLPERTIGLETIWPNAIFVTTISHS